MWLTRYKRASAFYHGYSVQTCLNPTVAELLDAKLEYRGKVGNYSAIQDLKSQVRKVLCCNQSFNFSTFQIDWDAPEVTIGQKDFSLEMPEETVLEHSDGPVLGRMKVVLGLSRLANAFDNVSVEDFFA